jgi:hypothetical protein
MTRQLLEDANLIEDDLAMGVKRPLSPVLGW